MIAIILMIVSSIIFVATVFSAKIQWVEDRETQKFFEERIQEKVNLWTGKK